MKRNIKGIALLCLILFANVACTQLAVNNFYYERYANTLIFAILNILLFPIAVLIYKREAHKS